MRKFIFIVCVFISSFILNNVQGQTYTLSNYIDWATYNQNMWGPNGNPYQININQNIFHVGFNQTETVGSITNVLGGQFGAEAILNVWLTMGMNFSLTGFSTGTIDLEYPVQIDLTFPSPNTFNPGETVTINSHYDVLPGWSLETHFPTAGVMALDFYFGAGTTLDVKVCVYTCTNFNVLNLQVPVDTIHLFYLNSNTGQAIYPCYQNGQFQFCNGTFPITFNNLFNIGLSGWITIPFVETQDYLDPLTKCLHAKGDCTYVHLDIDIVQFLWAIAGAIPPPQGPAIQQFISMLSGTIDLGFGVQIDYDLLNANLLLDFNLRQEFSFCPTVWAHLGFPTSVDYTVTDPANGNALIDSGHSDSIVFAVDYDLNFVYPCYGYPNWPIDIAHSITSGFTNHTWDSISFNFTLQAFEFTITLPIANMNNVIVPPFCINVPYPCPTPTNPNATCYNQVCSNPVYTPNFNSTRSTIHIGPLVNISIPLGFLPLTWFNQTWNIAGLHDTIVPGTTLYPNPEMTTTITGNNIHCAGDTTYLTVNVSYGTAPYTYVWSTGDSTVTNNTADSIIVSSGTYSVTITDANGCTQSHSVTVSVINPEIIINLTGSNVLCYGAATGSVTVVASGGTPPYTYLWHPGGATTPTLNNLTAGTYIVTVTDAVNCFKIDSIIITQPEIPYILTIDNVSHLTCYGDANGSIDISVSGGILPYSFLWSNGATTQNISNLTAGNYIITVTDADNCTLIDTIPVTQPDSMIVHINGTSICYGQNVTLQIDSTSGGTPPYTHLWSTGASGTSISVSPIVSTTYTVQSTDVNGCTSQITPIVVSVTAPLQLSLVPSSNIICIGDSLVINAVVSGGGQIQHTVYLSNGMQGIPPFVVYPTQDMYYTAWVTDSCNFTTVYDSVFVAVMPLPPADFTSDLLFGCEPLTVNFSETNPSQGQTYIWYFGNGNWGAGNNHAHTFQNYGVYNVTLTATSIYGCVNSQTIQNMITVYQKPIAEFSYNPKQPNSLETIIFDNHSTTYYAAHWNFGDGNTSDYIHAFHTYAFAGDYFVMLVAENSFGCKDTAVKDITIKEVNTFYVPNTFTPDGDGLNDIFMPIGQGFDNDSYQFIIFNRWGEKVFESNDINYGWDGKDSKKEYAPDGVYTWILYYKVKEDVAQKKFGTVILIR